MDRQYLTGPGPLTFTVTSTAATAKNGSWIKYGPCRANQITLGVAFSAASTKSTLTLQGLLSTSSTGQVFTIATRTYATRNAVIQSTVNTAVVFLRGRSSGSTTATSIVNSFYVVGTP